MPVLALLPGVSGAGELSGGSMRRIHAQRARHSAANASESPTSDGTGKVDPPAITTPAMVPAARATATHATGDHSKMRRPGIRLTGRASMTAEPIAAMQRLDRVSVTSNGRNPVTAPIALWASHAASPSASVTTSWSVATSPRDRTGTSVRKDAAITTPTMTGGWMPPPRDTRAASAAIVRNIGTSLSRDSPPSAFVTIRVVSATEIPFSTSSAIATAMASLR